MYTVKDETEIAATGPVIHVSILFNPESRLLFTYRRIDTVEDACPKKNVWPKLLPPAYLS